MQAYASALVAALLAIGAEAGPSSHLAAQELSVDEIVARCAEAMGLGPEGEGMRTVQFLLRGPDPTREVAWEIRRPDHVRKTRNGAWILVFDGTRAAYLEGPPDEDGVLAGPHLVPAEEWHDFLLDIALFVPAFFDYPAQYQGMETVGSASAYVLRVALPMGEEAVYSISTETFLPLKVTLPSWQYERFFGGWREVGGVTYFGNFWSQPDRSDLTRVDTLVMDEPIPDERFFIPVSPPR